MVSFDYSHDESELIIRMASALHEHMIYEIFFAIRTQLKNFTVLSGTRAAVRTAEIAKNIHSTGSAQLKFPRRKKNNLKRPDQSFRHKGPCHNNFPALIMEIAWSQTPLDLAKLANEYIGSGEIRTVIGIDLTYQRTPEVAPGTSARFLIWRAGLPDRRGKYSAGEPFEQVRSYLPSIHNSNKHIGVSE